MILLRLNNSSKHYFHPLPHRTCFGKRRYRFQSRCHRIRQCNIRLCVLLCFFLCHVLDQLRSQPQQNKQQKTVLLLSNGTNLANHLRLGHLVLRPKLAPDTPGLLTRLGRGVGSIDIGIFLKLLIDLKWVEIVYSFLSRRYSTKINSQNNLRFPFLLILSFFTCIKARLRKQVIVLSQQRKTRKR